MAGISSIREQQQHLAMVVLNALRTYLKQDLILSGHDSRSYLYCLSLNHCILFCPETVRTFSLRSTCTTKIPLKAD